MKKVFELMLAVEKFSFQNESCYIFINSDGIVFENSNNNDQIFKIKTSKLLKQEEITIESFLPGIKAVYNNYKQMIKDNDGSYDESLEEANALFDELFNKKIGKFFPEVKFSK